MISRREIKNLAELARIHLTEKEEQELERDLRTILEYVEKLKEVDVSKVPEMTHAVLIQNVFREDEEQVEREEYILLTDQFPEEELGYLKVKGVFERD